ncbi:uncharacterized protein LOC122505123 [Leptopilina heterotoma]|uniref:uncharacterized protein LOC122505123 n=1 Tax=Leptopilina heterotoma TaxID=63436 RepID=UPI001CAA3A57|nr:uncharacterized protein LOC122505123 [Leptopilina heterotoma]
MACCIPGCKTSYRDRTSDKLTLFTPFIDAQREEWEKILKEKTTLTKWKKNYRLCELHFSENVIERERNVFKKNGIVLKEVRKRPILSNNAIPSIFPDITIQKKQKVHLDYCVKISHSVFEESMKNRLIDNVLVDKSNNQSLNYLYSNENEIILKTELIDDSENCTIVKHEII